jgi:hypothetical protein
MNDREPDCVCKLHVRNVMPNSTFELAVRNLTVPTGANRLLEEEQRSNQQRCEDEVDGSSGASHSIVIERAAAAAAASKERVQTTVARRGGCGRVCCSARDQRMPSSQGEQLLAEQVHSPERRNQSGYAIRVRTRLVSGRAFNILGPAFC